MYAQWYYPFLQYILMTYDFLYTITLAMMNYLSPFLKNIFVIYFFFTFKYGIDIFSHSFKIFWIINTKLIYRLNIHVVCVK